MKPVEQTIMGEPHGDCLRACVASILELPIEQVPNFQQEDGNIHWYDRWQGWLAQFNLGWLSWQYDQAVPWFPPGYAIVGADSPRGPFKHAIVVYDGKIVWDPSPMREQGVGQWRDVTVFMALDPSQSVRRVQEMLGAKNA